MKTFDSLRAVIISILAALLFTLSFAQTSNDLKLELSFIESAPKDKFLLNNVGNCAISEAELFIDLSETAGKLIFDTTEAGLGVEVFQPFELLQGELELISTETVSDGATQLTLRLSNLEVGGQAGFTIDVDDRLPEGDLGMIRVTGAEMMGASVSMVNAGQEVRAVFGDDNRVTLTKAGCS